MLERKPEIIATYEIVIMSLTNTDKLNRESTRVQTELDGFYLELNQMVRRNAEMVQDQDEYNRVFDAFIERIRNTDGLGAFDEKVFAGTVDKVVVSGESKSEKS